MGKALRGVLRAFAISSADGTALVEFALVMPMLLLLLVGIADFGLAAYDAIQVQIAAEAGAQYAIRNPWDATAIGKEVQNATGVGGVSAIPAPAQVCGCPDGGVFTQTACGNKCPSGSPPGLYALVSAQFQYPLIMPYPGLSNPLTLAGHAYRRLN